MKYLKCDNCGIGIKDERLRVKLKGVSGKSGILLPEPFHRKDFCDSNCFWEWVEKNRRTEDSHEVNEINFADALKRDDITGEMARKIQSDFRRVIA